ncbi:MAG: hypothetical protein LBK25_09065 [Treponema sp.]|nr:hypothetical protein [Treponema sp.]
MSSHGGGCGGGVGCGGVPVRAERGLGAGVRRGGVRARVSGAAVSDTRGG